MNLLSVWILCLLCSVLTTYSAPTNQELFLQANAAYNAHEYEKALALYSAMTSKGSVTWYNMGNCAYQLKRHGDAYVYWKKSERDASWTLLRDTEYNLARLNHAASEESVSLYERIQQIMHSYYRWISLWWLQILGACIWSLFWLLYSKGALPVMRCMLLLLVCCCGIALKDKYTDMATKTGIVTKTPAVLYAGPHSQFHQITTLDESAEVTVIAQQALSDTVTDKPDWYKVSYKNLVGWISADNVNVV